MAIRKGTTNRVEFYRQIDRLNQEAWELSDTDAQQAYARAEQAYALAAQPPLDAPPDEVGMAASLRTLGYLNMRAGKNPLGINQLSHSLAILQTLPGADGEPGAPRSIAEAAAARSGMWPDDWPGTLADVYDGLAGIYAQIGSYPEALDLIHKQLAAAEAIGDTKRVSNALNNLAYIYLAMDDLPRAIEMQQRCLHVGMDYPRIRCLSLHNLAAMYLLTDEPAPAEEYALAALHESQVGKFALFELYAHRTLGKLHRLRGDTDASLRRLREAQQDARSLDSKAVDIAILLELGQTLAAAGRLEEARATLLEAAELAQAVDAASELFEAHQLLTEVCEQMDDPRAALFHFKRFHATKDRISGEKANQRLQVLQVVHDTELARKESEQLRGLNDLLEQQVASRTEELTATVRRLQHEIAQRERGHGRCPRRAPTAPGRGHPQPLRLHPPLCAGGAGAAPGGPAESDAC